MPMSFVVTVGFDEAERHYYVLSSDIPGLHIETETFEEFIDVVRNVMPDLVGDDAAGAKIRLERENRSCLMGGNLYSELTRLLREAGCSFVREVKGWHQIWRAPHGGKTFVV